MAQAIKRWSHVSDRAFRALMVMANTALDNPSRDGKTPAGQFFGGHDQIADVFASSGTPDSAKRTARRATDELESVGAIELIQEARLGSNARYQLTLNNDPKPYQKSRSESKHFTAREDTGCPTGADTPCPTGADTGCPTKADTPCPTYEEPLEEPLEELTEDEGVEVRADVLVIEPPARDENPNSISNSCPDPACRMGYIPNPNPDKRKRQRNIRCPTCRPATNVIPIGRRTA